MMDIRLTQKRPIIGRYKLPYYLLFMGEMIRNKEINLKTDRDGNDYVELPKKGLGFETIYTVLERHLLLPAGSITEVNLNMDRLQLDIYTFHTVSSRGLQNLEREYRVGYGLEDCIGIHIDLKPELLVLLQLQSCVEEED